MSPNERWSQVFLRALPLSERARDLPPDAEETGPLDAERAAKKLSRWRAERAFSSEPELWDRRLSQDGLTEKHLFYLLGETVEGLAARIPSPPWLPELLAAIGPEAETRPSDGAVSGAASGESLPLPPSLQGQALGRFLVAAEPFIARGCAALREGGRALLEGRKAAPFDPETLPLLCSAGLFAQLPPILSRTMVLELNVARVEERLAGESSEERFDSFIDSLRQQDRLAAIFEEYPVLARQLLEAVDAWVETHLELLERLLADYELLCRRFAAGAELGQITHLRSEAGDRHRGGRTVMILTFSSEMRLVYKPKSLAVDAHFQELLTFLNERGQSPPLCVLNVLDRGDYGFTEYVARSSCTDEGQVHRFYKRQGANLALLYVLLGTDGHYENIIAAGENPMLVDLESLFHAHFVAPEATDPVAIVATSVLRTGLLPRREWTTEDSEGIDTSGIGSSSGQLSPRAAQRWTSGGTDAMRMERKRVLVGGGDSKAALHGEPVEALDYSSDVLEGFESTYQRLMQHREELLAPQGPIARFSNDVVRAILRPTHIYSLLLRESFHPDLLRDALDRDRFFDRLWAMLRIAPYLERVIPAERAALWQRDIPMFTSSTNSRDLIGPSGERIEQFFPHSPMHIVRARIAALGEDDLARQSWFVRASFSALLLGEAHARMPSHTLVESETPFEPAELIAQARSVGQRLAQLSLEVGEGVAWIGLAPVRERYWEIAPLNLDLYSGVAGVALFLAHLGEITGEAQFSELARRAAKTLRTGAANRDARVRGIGAYSGWGGILYSLLGLGALFVDDSLVEEAHGLIEHIAEGIDQSRHLDVLSGTAGAVLSLLRLHRVRPDGRALAVAVRGGDRLLAEARSLRQGGLGWTTQAVPEPSTGLAHGSAGIAWALSELGAVTGEARFRDSALRAIEGERALLSSASGDPLTSWCYGSCGIGLGRILVRRHLDVPDIDIELTRAVQLTEARGFGASHSLCHGDLGTLDFLLQAQGDSLSPRLVASVARSVATLGPRCGAPIAAETPGLLVGLAGIGYGLLRVASPGRVPSVLALELPSGVGFSRPAQRG